MGDALPASSSPVPGYRRARLCCARCGAAELHRSRPRTLAERLIHGMTPLTSYRCPACGKRALHLGETWSLPESRVSTDEAASGGSRRRSQKRPSRIRSRDSLRTLALAIGLGLGVGLLLVRGLAG